MRTWMSDCCFCAEFAGEATDFHRLYPDLAGRMVLETERFVVLPSLGQLAQGHLLIVPRLHATSFGELDEAARREVEKLYSDLRALMGRQFSPPVCFEHGSSRSADAGGCGITHAHLHLVPLGGRRAETPRPAGAGWRETRPVNWLDEAANLASQGLGYLMWHGPDASPLLDVVSDLPSQYLREHVAGVLGHDRWDWRCAGPQPELWNVLRVDWVRAEAALAVH
jgi:diadenosine tetraphosphate (Ap4A) HIT family hydrolase